MGHPLAVEDTLDERAVSGEVRSEPIRRTGTQFALSHKGSIPNDQRSYKIADFYSDSLHVGTAMYGDCTVISSDDAFDKVKEVTRIDPRGL